LPLWFALNLYQARPRSRAGVAMGVTTMATKLILRWDIQPGVESEYFEFMVSDFIPSLKRMGITEPSVWYTAYGDTEQILVSGVTETQDHMKYVLRSNDWSRLRERLDQLVTNYDQRVARATGGFQL
jgi:hypothetical protein